jgi:hypothetical protein
MSRVKGFGLKGGSRAQEIRYLEHCLWFRMELRIHVLRNPRNVENDLRIMVSGSRGSGLGFMRCDLRIGVFACCPWPLTRSRDESELQTSVKSQEKSTNGATGGLESSGSHDTSHQSLDKSSPKH